MKKNNLEHQVLIFPDGTRVRLSEVETYQPDNAEPRLGNGVTVKLRSGRTLFWSAIGSTAEQKARHTADVLAGLDLIFNCRNLTDEE